jgi:hypothetical protein
MLTGMLVLIWVVCVAMLWNEGMWNNCLTFVNALFAALLAMNYWEPASDFVESKMGSYTYVIDFLTMWFIFFLSYIVLRAVTDSLSKTQVKFKMPIERTGRVVSVIAIGWLLVCFTVTSLHTAPLARTAVKGGFQAEPMSNNFLGTAPDRMWLGFVQHRSKNALANSPPVVFDERGEYIFKYGGRRELFSQQSAVRVGQ